MTIKLNGVAATSDELLGIKSDLGTIADLLNFRTNNANLFPDPFFTDSTLADGYRNQADSPFFFAGAWTSLSTLAGQKYPVGKTLLRPDGNVSAPYLWLSLNKLGLTEGDVFRIATEAKRVTGSGSITTGTAFVSGQFYQRNGTAIGSVFDVILPTVGTPLSGTLNSFTTGDLTVPANAGRLRLSAPWKPGTALGIESIQVVLGVAPDEPTQNYIPENLGVRLASVEAANMQSRSNNLLLRRTTYSALTVTQALGGISTFAAFQGYGSNLLATACPVAGFNAIQDAWKWTPGATAPAEILVQVTTSPTGTDALNAGRLIAVGKIGVDPIAGTAGGAPIQLFEPDWVTPKTVLPADLDDNMGISFCGIKPDGTYALNMYVSRNADLTLNDPSFPGYFIPGGGANVIGVGGFWSPVAAGYIWGPKLVNLTSPTTAPDVASVKLSNSVGLNIAEPPDLIAVPQKLWARVGKETWLHYQTTQLRDSRATGFSGGTIPTTIANLGIGARHIPVSAGSVNLTLTAQANGIDSISKTCAFSSIAVATGAGTARFLMLGDSMTASGGMQTRLNALAVGDVTSIVNMGTIGADPVKNEGYSGQGNGIFFTPGNPFYNPDPLVETFDFDYYMTNLAVADPTHVLIASGFWNAAYSTSDGDCRNSAASWAAQVELMIASIHAYNSAIKVGVWTQPVHPITPEGQAGDAQQTAGLSVARRRRNMILFGQASIDAFSAREGSNVYSVAVGQTMNPDTQYSRADYAPIDSHVEARVVATPYANYAALDADLTPIDGTIVKVTNGGGFKYYVKVWGPSLGHWRIATEADGFIKRITDSIHTGFNAGGDLVWSWIKATI